MRVATTAPGRPKLNRFTVVAIGPFRGNQMLADIRVDDENGTPAGEFQIYTTETQATGLRFTPTGQVEVFGPVAVGGDLLADDFAAFAATAGDFATRAAAVEARYQATMRIPA
jgi:hypothetical protein